MLRVATLYCDAGNSRLKWWLVAEEQQLDSGVWLYQMRCDSPLVKWSKRISLQQVVVAAVVERERLDPLWEALSPWLKGIVPTFIAADAIAGLVDSDYDLTQLGVDRALAIAAVSASAHAIVVVDCGTSVTVELVTSKQRYLGGYILPGVAMISELFRAHTAAVRLDGGVQPIVAAKTPGTNTQQALLHGSMVAVGETVAYAINYLQQLEQQLPKLVVTGGDGQIMAQQFKHPFQLRPDLILSGMQRLQRLGRV